MEKDTKNGFAYADQRNCYGDFPTAYIDAHYRDGQFYDQENGRVVTLKEEAPVRLVVQRMDIPEADRSRFHSTARKVLDEGTKLRFHLTDTKRVFHVVLLSDLFFEKNGNKPARACSVRCAVHEKIDALQQSLFPLFEVSSLNQAYFQASIRYRPEARAHTGSIYKNFYIDGTKRTLADLRF